MKKYYKACKNIEQVNKYLRKIGCEAFEFDYDAFEVYTEEFDYDGWQNEEETEGISVKITPSYEVFVTKYTRKDLEKIEKECGI